MSRLPFVLLLACALLAFLARIACFEAERGPARALGAPLAAAADAGAHTAAPALRGAPDRAAVRRAAVAPAPARRADAPARLEGSLRAWSGAPFERARVRLEPDQPGPGRLAILRPDLDGRFRSDSLAPGAYTVSLGARDDPRRGPRLGALVLAPGPNPELVLDVADHLHGAVVVRVAGARPGEPLRAWCAPVDAPDRPTPRHEADADGVAYLPAVAPGDHVVVIEAPERGTVALAPERLRVAPGATAVVDVALALAEGDVRVLDAESGEPLAGVPVRFAPIAPVAHGDVPSAAVVARSDADGRVRASLAPGAYRVLAGTGPFPPGIGETITWTQAGAAPAVVRATPIFEAFQCVTF